MKRIASIIMLLGATLGAFAQQPLTGCWFPEDILNWSAADDPYFKYNRSITPRAERLREPSLMAANERQSYTGQICNATILYPNCGSSPAQGASYFTGYSPTYWQYMDKVVYWAGSSGEGIICPPPAYSIDAAHLNGVKILGNVFFPPTYYGGKKEWVEQMLTKSNGEYVYARKLFEIARDLGFDGWFINEETVGGNVDKWTEFIGTFQQIADAEGYRDMEIQWYDAKRTPNVPILSAHKNVSQFIEYGAVKDWRSYASQIGCTEEEVFNKIYCGVECVQSGLMGYNSALNSAFPKSGEHVTSLDLFCPEEHAWKRVVSSLLGTEDACGNKAYDAQRTVFGNEQGVWVNRKGDPTQIENSWRGISGCIAERSVVSSMPFASQMCNGLGKYRFIRGEKVAEGDWWHTGLQQILPTWRWWIEDDNTLKVSENWDDAWQLGSSYTVSGTLTAGNHLMRLYKTMVPVEGNATLRLVYKSNGGEIIPVVATESSLTEGQTELTSSLRTTENGWTIDTYDLSALSGKTIYMLALNLHADADIANYSASIGEIALLPEGYVSASPAITKLANNSKPRVDGMDLCLTWDNTYTPDLDHIDIYVTDASGRRLAGQTRGTGYYIPDIRRDAKDTAVTVNLVTVLKDGNEVDAASLTVDYPALTAPEASLKPSASYAAVGDKVTISCIASPCPENYSWEVSDELKIIDKSGENLIVEAVVEGLATITATVSNPAGTTTVSSRIVDVLSSADKAKVKNVALGKSIVDYSGAANNTEVPRNLLDGKTSNAAVSEKWCVANSAENSVTIDLQNNYKIYGFRIWDCKSGPENYENIANYRILLSEDGKEWHEVVNESNRQGDNIKEDFITPTAGRYVQLKIWNPLPFTMRMWEFEVIGYDPESNAVEQLRTDNTLRARIEGDSIVVETANDSIVRLLSLDGKVLEEARSLQGSARLRKPTSGAYLIEILTPAGYRLATHPIILSR